MYTQPILCRKMHSYIVIIVIVALNNRSCEFSSIFYSFCITILFWHEISNKKSVASGYLKTKQNHHANIVDLIARLNIIKSIFLNKHFFIDAQLQMSVIEGTFYIRLLCIQYIRCKFQSDEFDLFVSFQILFLNEIFQIFQEIFDFVEQ